MLRDHYGRGDVYTLQWFGQAPKRWAEMRSYSQAKSASWGAGRLMSWLRFLSGLELSFTHSIEGPKHDRTDSWAGFAGARRGRRAFPPPRGGRSAGLFRLSAGGQFTSRSDRARGRRPAAQLRRQ